MRSAGTGIFIYIHFIVILIFTLAALYKISHHIPTIMFSIKVRKNTLECEQIESFIKSGRSEAFVNSSKQFADDLLNIVRKPSFCEPKNKNSAFAVVLIDSARANIADREVVRESWASLKSYKNWEIRTVFLLGQNQYCAYPNRALANGFWLGVKHEEMMLSEEQDTFDDLVIGSFTDTYRNLTYKHLMGYKYVLESCPKADFIVKSDDDMFVNLPAILDSRQAEMENSKGPVADMYCRSMDHDKGPTRCQKCKNGKWFSTREEWPSDKYPRYCLGGCFAISREWVQYIYQVRMDGGFFWIDDVFITGKLREIAVHRIGRSTLFLRINDEVNLFTADTIFEQYFRTDLSSIYVPWFKAIPRNERFKMRMRRLWEIVNSSSLLV